MITGCGTSLHEYRHQIIAIIRLVHRRTPAWRFQTIRVRQGHPALRRLARPNKMCSIWQHSCRAIWMMTRVTPSSQASLEKIFDLFKVLIFQCVNKFRFHFTPLVGPTYPFSIPIHTTPDHRHTAIDIRFTIAGDCKEVCFTFRFPW